MRIWLLVSLKETCLSWAFLGTAGPSLGMCIAFFAHNAKAHGFSTRVPTTSGQRVTGTEHCWDLQSQRHPFWVMLRFSWMPQQRTALENERRYPARGESCLLWEAPPTLTVSPRPPEVTQQAEPAPGNHRAPRRAKDLSYPYRQAVLQVLGPKDKTHHYTGFEV